MLVSRHEIIDACIFEVTEATIIYTPSKLESAKLPKKIEKIQLAHHARPLLSTSAHSGQGYPTCSGHLGLVDPSASHSRSCDGMDLLSSHLHNYITHHIDLALPSSLSSSLSANNNKLEPTRHVLHTILAHNDIRPVRNME